MSKVRIYDLAKEFGLKSKELAEKLIAMGYPIASHSSSVDEDMAADMRRKLQGAVATGAGGGRIALKNRADSAAVKTPTVVRRRSRAEKEEAARAFLAYLETDAAMTAFERVGFSAVY